MKEAVKFGTQYAPKMLHMKMSRETGPGRVEILPMADTMLSPATSALHYGQSIFEGMKAYRHPDRRIAIFRPNLHAKRFRLSARRMAMAEIPEEVFTKALREFVAANKDFVPSDPEQSFYLRPLQFASDKIIKLKPSTDFEFFIMGTIAGPYFSPEAFNKGASVFVDPEFVRAFPGGTGEAKTCGNYAATLLAQAKAAAQGCDQVLYLDAREHTFIDELGGMNFFMVKGRKLLTPKLNGAILDGVTRKSILELAPSLDLEPEERSLSIEDVITDLRSGGRAEIFACGTAAVVAPIGELVMQRKGSIERVPCPGPFTATAKIHQALTNIQFGRAKDPNQWLEYV